MITPVDIVALVATLGGSQLEQQILLAISWAESRHNENAVGDNGWSHGLFQAERIPGVPIKQQIKTALSRIREQEKYFGQQLRSMSNFIDCSPEMIMRFHRAAWQTHPKMPSNWLSWLNNQIFDLREQHEKIGFQLTDEDVLEALTGERRKLNVIDMITWAGKRNVNAQALFDGQQQISEYLKNNNTVLVSKAGGSLKTLFFVIGGMLMWYLVKK